MSTAPQGREDGKNDATGQNGGMEPRDQRSAFDFGSDPARGAAASEAARKLNRAAKLQTASAWLSLLPFIAVAGAVVVVLVVIGFLVLIS